MAKSNKNKVHVQFNDQPIIISPSTSDPSDLNIISNKDTTLPNRKETNLINNNIKSSLKQKSNDSACDNKKDEGTIQQKKEIIVNNNNNLVVKSTPGEEESQTNELQIKTEDLKINDQESIPPPINLTTLPPRSSLYEGQTLDLPLELLSPEVNTTQPNFDVSQCPISLIGNMVQTPQTKAETILVSTAYTNLPSPLSIPAPLEIPNAPLIINKNPNLPNVQNYRPMSAYIPVESSYATQRPLSGHVYVQPAYLIQNPGVMTPVSYVQQPVLVDTFMHQPYEVVNYPYPNVPTNVTPVPFNSTEVVASTDNSKKVPPPVPTKPIRNSEYFPDCSVASENYSDLKRHSAHIPIPDPSIETGNINPNIPYQSVDTNMHVSISSDNLGVKDSLAHRLDKVTRSEVGLYSNFFFVV